MNKPGPKPRNGRDPARRNLINLAVLGTKSKRSESRLHRTHRIANYLDDLARQQFGCTARRFLQRISPHVEGQQLYQRSFSRELEYAEVLLYVADECPEDWLRIVNKVCAEEQKMRTEHGYEPNCTSTHSANIGGDG